MRLPVGLAILTAACFAFNVNAQTPQSDSMCESRDVKIALEGPPLRPVQHSRLKNVKRQMKNCWVNCSPNSRMNMHSMNAYS